MGAEDGSWLTLGDSDGVDVGLPVLVGFILGWEDGAVEMLGPCEG